MWSISIPTAGTHAYLASYLNCSSPASSVPFNHCGFSPATRFYFFFFFNFLLLTLSSCLLSISYDYWMYLYYCIMISGERGFRCGSLGTTWCLLTKPASVLRIYIYLINKFKLIRSPFHIWAGACAFFVAEDLIRWRWWCWWQGPNYSFKGTRLNSQLVCEGEMIYGTSPLGAGWWRWEDRQGCGTW